MFEIASNGDVQMPSSNGTLQSMTYLGNTFNGKHFVYNPSSSDPAKKLAPTSSGPWRHDSNGNPTNMLEVVQALLPDLNIVFVVERNLNRNVVLYCVNETRPGVVNGDNPITVMWLMISAPAPPTTTECDEVDLGNVYTEDLNTLERTLAYGVSNVTITGNTEFKTRICAVSGEDITIRYSATDKTWEALILMQNTYLRLNRFRIFTEPRKFAPWPKTVELHVDAKLMAGNAITYHFAV